MNKKEKQGQNKGRSFPVLREASIRICRAWESTGVCDKGPTCKWAHSWEGYFAVKPADIHWEASGMLSDSPQYVVLGERVVGGEDEVGRTIDLKTECPVYKDLGYCPYAWRCRFLGGHVRRLTEAEKAEKKEDDVGSVGDWACEGLEGKVAIDNEQRWKRDETNWPTPTLLTTLRTSAVRTSPILLEAALIPSTPSPTLPVTSPRLSRKRSSTSGRMCKTDKPRTTKRR